MSETGSSPVASLQDGGSGIRLRQTSQVTLVPNSYPAKLMYYLDCVCTVLELDDDPVMNRLRQYHRCDLTTQQIDTLLSLCYTFGPDLLNKKCFFNNDGLCGTSGNRFYNLDVAAANFIAFTDSILICGRLRQIKKIMAYRREWLFEYFTQPMEIVYNWRLQQVRGQAASGRAALEGAHVALGAVHIGLHLARCCTIL